MQSCIQRDPALATDLLREGLAEPTNLTEAILETTEGMPRVGIMGDEIHIRIKTQHRACVLNLVNHKGSKGYLWLTSERCVPL